MSYSLSSFKQDYVEGYIGDYYIRGYIGSVIGLLKGDTRSLDHVSYKVHNELHRSAGEFLPYEQ